MTAWLLVWLVVTLTTTVLLATFLVALVRHGMLLARAASRLAEETGQLSAAIGRDATRASERAAGFSLKDRSAPRR